MLRSRRGGVAAASEGDSLGSQRPRPAAVEAAAELRPAPGQGGLLPQLQQPIRGQVEPLVGARHLRQLPGPAVTRAVNEPSRSFTVPAPGPE